MNSAACGRCGWELSLPPIDEACLDERGAVHLMCAACGSENAVAGDVAPPASVRSRRRGHSGVGLLMWLVILGMLLLMLPGFQVIAPPKPVPPTYMVT